MHHRVQIVYAKCKRKHHLKQGFPNLATLRAEDFTWLGGKFWELNYQGRESLNYWVMFYLSSFFYFVCLLLRPCPPIPAFLASLLHSPGMTLPANHVLHDLKLISAWPNEITSCQLAFNQSQLILTLTQFLFLTWMVTVTLRKD